MHEPAADAYTIAVRTHGRYLVREAAGNPAGLLVGFHGYGQAAEDLLSELVQVPGASAWTIVAVQGLHRFYDRRQARVVASWMTRQDRELAIADNIAYVDAVVDAVQATLPAGPLVFAGFSQGVAMAFRAAALGRHRSQGVIALGGELPPDVRANDAVRLPPVLVGRGARDEYYGAEGFAADVAWLDARGWLAAGLGFDGGHAFSDTFRAAAGALLADVMTGASR